MGEWLGRGRREGGVRTTGEGGGSGLGGGRAGDGEGAGWGSRWGVWDGCGGEERKGKERGGWEREKVVRVLEGKEEVGEGR